MPIQTIALNIAIVIASLYILFKAADLIVFGISDYAKKLGLSDYLIGLVVVAMAASTPEVISSVFGLMLGKGEVLFGSILGANMVHFALAIGVLLLIGKKMSLDAPIFEKKKLLMWIFMMLPFVLMLDGTLSRSDGVVLVGTFIFYLSLLWKQEGTIGKIKKYVTLKNIWRDMVIFAGGLVALILAGKWLVTGAVNLSTMVGLPAYLVALTVIGFGTTLPDFIIEFRALKKGHTAIGVGDALGSAMIELILYFGVVAIIKPLQIPLNEIFSTVIFLAVSLTALLFLVRKKQATWKHGLILVGIYLVFMAVEILKAIHVF
jgi:cation:H+ antiporter